MGAVATVVFNGMDRGLRFEPDQLVAELNELARELFSSAPPVPMALFTEHGVELDPTGTAADAGLTSGCLLVLRPRTVGA